MPAFAGCRNVRFVKTRNDTLPLPWEGDARERRVYWQWQGCACIQALSDPSPGMAYRKQRSAW